jgi:hypothetical protein
LRQGFCHRQITDCDGGGESQGGPRMNFFSRMFRSERREEQPPPAAPRESAELEEKLARAHMDAAHAAYREYLSANPNPPIFGRQMIYGRRSSDDLGNKLATDLINAQHVWWAATARLAESKNH